MKMIFRKGCVKVPGDRVPWWAFANTVMDLGCFVKQVIS
jgi:hypothetical protein